MAEKDETDPDVRRQAVLARIREQRRAADRADAYLLLQQTIQADLAVRGELGPDEFVELVRTEEGTVLVCTVSATTQVPQVEQDASSAYRTMLGLQAASAMRGPKLSSWRTPKPKAVSTRPPGIQ
jgi:hypothetical protein